MDWTSCIYQQYTSEQFSCSAVNYSKYDPFTVYENLLLNVEEFNKLTEVPVELRFVGE